MTARPWTTALTGLVMLMLAAVSPAAADPFTVRDINVDLTRETAGAAREEALANAHREAFAHLMRRLTTPEWHSSLPQLSYEEIVETVAGLQVVRERMSSTRYIGELVISFEPDDVRRVLASRDIPFTDVQAPPVVILPLFGEGGQTVLWEGDNPWREAWRFHGPADGLVPTILPDGDEDDAALVDASRAAAMDEGALQALAEQYGAEGGIVARATWTVSPGSGSGSVTVEARGFGLHSLPEGWRERVTGEQGESAEQVSFRAARRLIAAMEDAWKADMVVSPGEGYGSVEATMDLRGIEDLVAARQSFERVPFLRRADLVSLTRREAQFRLQFAGDVERLRDALDRQGLRLIPAIDGTARLVPAGANVAPLR